VSCGAATNSHGVACYLPNYRSQTCNLRSRLQVWPPILFSKTSSSFATATLVGFGLLNYRWVFSAGRFLQSAVASGTSNPQTGGPVIRTFQLWSLQRLKRQFHYDKLIYLNLSSGRWKLWARNCREFYRKWRLPCHFWVLLHAVNLRHCADGFTSPPKEGALRIFSPEKSDGFGRVWTRELGYQRSARSPLDHRSRYSQKL